MYKRIASLLLAAVFIFSSLPSYAADTPDILVNETFINYAENGEAGSIEVKGLDSRVVTHDGNKVLYSKMWGSGMNVKIPLSQSYDKMVFAYDLKVQGGKYVGKAIPLTGTSSIINYDVSGAVKLEDGYKIGGVPVGKWQKYAIAVDFQKKSYSLYIDGKAVVEDWYFSQTISNLSEFSISLTPVNDEEEIDVYIDNIRVYEGNAILTDSAFAPKEKNTDVVEFTPTTQKPEATKVFVDSNGKTGLESLGMVSKDGSTISWATHPDNGIECIRAIQTGTKDCYAEFQVAIGDSTSFVYQVDVYPVAFNGGQATIIRAEGKDGSGSNILTFEGGMLRCDGRNVCALPYGRWSTVAIAFDLYTGLGDIYLGGELIQSGVGIQNGGASPDKIRFSLNTVSNPGPNEIYFNRIKFYEGKKLRSFEDDDATKAAQNQGNSDGEYVSCHDTKEMALELLGTDTVFLTNCDTYFSNGAKMKYSDSGALAFEDENGIAFVSSDLISTSLGVEISQSGDSVKIGQHTAKVGSRDSSAGTLSAAPMVKEGKLCLPIESVARLMLGKYVYVDNRNYVLISDTNRRYSNDITPVVNLEDSDKIHRFLQFDRPDGEQIYNAVAANSANVYPRTLVRKEEINALRQKIVSNDRLRNGLANLLIACEGYIDAPLVEYVKNGVRIFIPCYTVKTRLFDLGIAYLITDEDKYAKRMWEEMENALGWKDWNVDSHFLDSGEISTAMAFAYDVLHDYLTDEQKAFFRERVDKLFLDAAVRCYTNDLYCSAKNYRLVETNWGAVCGSAMLMMSLVLMDEEAPDSELTKKCKFIAPNALQSLEYAIGQFFPDGIVVDGVGYWDYYMEGIGWSIKTLQNMCGDDYGLLDSPGYRTTPDFMLYIQAKTGRYNYSSTNGEGKMWTPEAYLVASFYEDDVLMKTLDIFRQNLDFPITAFDLLWYQEPVAAAGKEYALDKYFTGEGLTTMRSSWTDSNGVFIGIKNGRQDSEAHYDKGSFVLDIGGERWLNDLGTENYNIPGGTAGDGGKRVYRIRAEGHNTMVFNPTAKDPGQSMGAFTTIVRNEIKPRGVITVLDLSQAYKDFVDSHQRGFFLSDNRETLTVRDELVLKSDNTEFYSFYHTRADVTVSDDGKSAILESHGKKLKAEFICDAPEWKLEVRDCSNMFPENDKEGEYSRDEFKKLTVVGKASGKMTLTVKFSLVDGESVYAPVSNEDIASWNIPDGEIPPKPTLDAIYMDGQKLDGFNPELSTHTVRVPLEMELPTFSATSSDGTVSIKQPEDFGSPVEITVVSSNGRKMVYYVQFELESVVVDSQSGLTPSVGLPDGANLINPISAESDCTPEIQNIPINTYDGKLNTKWAGDEYGCYLEIDLGKIREIDGIALAFVEGSVRKYNFEIQISEDKRTYRRVFAGQSTGKTEEYEHLPLTANARYIRLVGYGNSENEWNNISEIHPYVN